MAGEYIVAGVAFAGVGVLFAFNLGGAADKLIGIEQMFPWWLRWATSWGPRLGARLFGFVLLALGLALFVIHPN